MPLACSGKTDLNLNFYGNFVVLLLPACFARAILKETKHNQFVQISRYKEVYTRVITSHFRVITLVEIAQVDHDIQRKGDAVKIYEKKVDCQT